MNFRNLSLVLFTGLMTSTVFTGDIKAAKTSVPQVPRVSLANALLSSFVHMRQDKKYQEEVSKGAIIILRAFVQRLELNHEQAVAARSLLKSFEVVVSDAFEHKRTQDAFEKSYPDIYSYAVTEEKLQTEDEQLKRAYNSYEAKALRAADEKKNKSIAQLKELASTLITQEDMVALSGMFAVALQDVKAMEQSIKSLIAFIDQELAKK